MDNVDHQPPPGHIGLALEGLSNYKRLAGWWRMAIDNEVYDRAGQTWWDDDNPLIMLHGASRADGSSTSVTC